MRTPSTGREVIIEAEPDRVYLDRETRRAARAGGPAASARARPFGAALGRREPPLLQLVRPARTEGPERLPPLRTAHGPARVLARPVAMRRPVASFAALVLRSRAGRRPVGLRGRLLGDRRRTPSGAPSLTVPGGSSASAAVDRDLDAAASTTTQTSTTSTDDDRGELVRRRPTSSAPRRTSARDRRDPGSAGRPARARGRHPEGRARPAARPARTGGTDRAAADRPRHGSEQRRRRARLGVLPAEPRRLLAPRSRGVEPGCAQSAPSA